MYAQVRGTLTPKTRPVEVNIPSAGRIVAGKIQLWQRVKKGQVLFTLDALARDPQDAALQLSIQQSAASQAQQEITSAQIDLDNKRRAETSARIIFNLGGLPRVDLEAAVDAVNTAEAQLQRAKSQLSSVQARLALLTRNQKVDVLSPIDGQVMQLSDLHVGQTLSAGQLALGILPEGVPLVFRGNAAEQDRPKLRAGSQVHIAWNGYPRQKYGVTKAILQGVAPTSEIDKGGSVSYQVEIKLPQQGRALALKDRPLVVGMVGEAQVLSGKRTVLQLFWDWIRGADPWS
ncbi:efflux RND transporter periplasmic adaptor subunit [Deinococcus puniceus]|uniref:efflux RND transporter periplasmic adaptor subunit n=1 Tax=Deinococcus puniceus TaxID=1182568 RepID=UPI0018D399C0|nr:HlyD family efflux transporter periplasmic adaptor subunit [Deinococcus puniceus]